MNKNRMLFGVMIVLILAMVISSSSAFSLFGKQPTKIGIGSNGTIDKGNEITVKLTDNNGTPIVNQTIKVIITGEGIKENNSVITNSKGCAKIKMDYGAGRYTVNCTYTGNDDMQSSMSVKNITINEIEETEYDYSDYEEDYGAFYSYQDGRTIYTGEIREGPDGNYYEHLGYNEWVLV
ncbi:MAG: Ig-like domain-containing protein [Methanobrevibacter sp.]|nr:Ig-like domain-containing protein [Methanobrevibacter sp.]